MRTGRAAVGFSLFLCLLAFGAFSAPSEAWAQACTPVAPDDVTCDGVDDDCDGSFDEDFPPGAYGLDLGASTGRVTFGPAAALGSATFTLEIWFQAHGAGTTASTGSGGMDIVPLITKGMHESDGSSLDMNYFLGIRGSDRVLAADFEDTASGLNHPVAGTTPIANGVWYHAAATFDGATWRLYLNGALEAQLTVNATPRADSIQHAGLGVAMNSSGTTEGHFDGVIDEARVWSYARTQAQILTGLEIEIPSASGLLGRWGLNDGCRGTAADSSGSGVAGTIAGSGWAWASGSPFAINHPPAAPILNAPPDMSHVTVTTPTLDVTVTDPDGEPMSVSFFGREVTAAGPDFTIVALPDAQYYSKTYPATFNQQTQWIVDNKASLDIAFATQLGDLTDSGDAAPQEWTNASAAMSILQWSVPYGVLPGNHDQPDPNNNVYYDNTFPVSRFAAQPWYGEGFRQNRNSYQTFTAGGMDFIILHLEYDAPDDAIAWANGVLAAHPNHRAIVSTHIYFNSGGTARSSAPYTTKAGGNGGEQIWNELVYNNCNIFMVLAGHWPGEALLQSTNACGDTVHQMLMDYQGRSNGGDGWLRYFTFRPGSNRIDAYTYSPKLGQFETDGNSQFSLAYPMQGSSFALVGAAANVASGARATTAWPGLTPGKSYEWYAVVSDGVNATTGPLWSFTVQQDCTAPAPNDPTCDDVDDDCDGQFDEDYVPVPTSCGAGVCAAAGTTSCVGGQILDSCAPGPAQVTHALDFNGSSSYVDMGGGAVLNDHGLASFTVETWLKLDTAGTYMGIFRQGRQGTASQFTLQLPGSSPYNRITASVEDGAAHQVDYTPVSIDTGRWYHVAAVVDRATNQLLLYLDGALAGTPADISALAGSPISSMDSTILGASRIADGTLSYFLDGQIDEVRMWNRARTASEIRDNYLREIASHPDLIARWGLDDGSGTTAADSVGAYPGNNPGTVYQAVWTTAAALSVERVCDGLDQDCDGATDEDYVPNAACGVGACRTNNAPSSCAAGIETPCQPGTPAPSDATCDSVDDDCDAATDEDYLPRQTTCGNGVCQAAGATACAGGVEVDNCAPGAPPLNYGLHLDGTREYVTFGAAPGLGAATFTIEAWFRRDGAGATANTGTGGVLAIPLVTKGRGETEGSNVDMNWFLGIRATDNKLVADFEDMATGGNHPIAGTTTLVSNRWYHAAAAYDGATWTLYLDGNLEATAAAGATPRWDSIQHAAIGTALNSTGVAEGWLDGVIDEVRVWNVALTQAQVRSGMTQEMTGGAGLAARWGLNEGAGSVIADSSGHGIGGTLLGGAWVEGTPFTGGPVAPVDFALDFDGTEDHVTFGAAPSLGASAFTLETWFNRQGAGTQASTGTGGINAVPLVTKGRGEADGSNLDMNYFLGIDPNNGNVLAVDFEDTAGGANHPLRGVTAVTSGTWHHAAAVYDGATWRLYLDGNLEATLAVNRTPRYDSIQHAALGTAMTSAGSAAGRFDGLMDEVRIWSVARSQQEIRDGMKVEIAAAPGLLGRWGFNEGTGSSAVNSVTGGVNGSLTGASHLPVWVDGYPFASRPAVHEETCNGLDDDCDGATDEDYVAAPTSCGVGQCSGNTGQMACLPGGVIRNTCDPFGGATVEVCDGADNDCNGAPDDAQVPGLGATIDVSESSGTSHLTWSPLPSAQTYDVVRGDLGTLAGSGGNFTTATQTCAGSDLLTTWVDDPDLPALGQGHWYVVRGVNCGGHGTFESGAPSQQGLRDQEIDAAPGRCP